MAPNVQVLLLPTKTTAFRIGGKKNSSLPFGNSEILQIKLTIERCSAFLLLFIYIHTDATSTLRLKEN